MQIKKLWDTMKSTTNMIPTRKPLNKTEDNTMANDLNNFKIRLDSHDFSLKMIP